MVNEIEKPAASQTHQPAAPALSQVIELLIAEGKTTKEPTLGDIRSALLAPHVFWSLAQRELLYAQDQVGLVIELDELIDRYGAQAPAHEFIECKAGNSVTAAN